MRDRDFRRGTLERLEAAWSDFHASYAGLSDVELLEPGVADDWSVRDLIAHVAWWDEEAIKHLPVILAGKRPPRYSVTYSGIDAFNALMSETRRDLSLDEVRTRAADVHARLVAYLEAVPPEELKSGTRFRRRLQLDSIGHYPLHTSMVRAWRQSRSDNRTAIVDSGGSETTNRQPR